MKIDILVNDGSPRLVTSKMLWGDKHQIGLGGAEYALITMAEEWTKAGNEVRLYNDPIELNASPFEQFLIKAFNPNDDRDVLIVFRSPNLRAIPAKGLKVWWSCDQQTVGNFAEFSHYVDRIVCISPYHAHYFKSRYGITNTTVIDLPVRLDDFVGLKFPKVPNRLIFMSVPARGLDNLLRIYPIINESWPDVETTNIGTVLDVDADNPSNDKFFANTVLELLEDRNILEIKRAKNKVLAKIRFAPENILKQWQEKVFA